MARVDYSAAARDDLIRLLNFLVQTGTDHPARMVDDITHAIEALVRHPRIGRPLDCGLRELVISHGATGYVALYDYSALYDDVLILRIRHQREEDHH